MRKVEAIPAALEEIFRVAAERRITTARAADEVAERILREARQGRSMPA